MTERERFALALGKLFSNLQALEFLLRNYLYNRLESHMSALHVKLHEMNVGDSVALNAFTDYRSLGQLIGRYNVEVATDPNLVVDPSVVSLRDALAHGRVSSPTLGSLPTPRIIKFDRPVGNTTRVVFAEVMTLDWLQDQATRIAREIQKVAAASPHITTEPLF